VNGPRIGSSSLDAALRITKQLQADLHAEVTAVDADPAATTIYLSVPHADEGELLRMRRERWNALVIRNVRLRREHTSVIALRVGRQRAHLGESRALVTANQGALQRRAKAAELV
jgi:hypothetical protein